MKKKSLNAKKKIHKLIFKHLNNQKVLKIFKEFNIPLKKNLKYAVAVSGGSDSLSLAFLAKCFSLKNKSRIEYYIVDHGLRKNSSTEAKLVSSILRNFDINCKILTWKGSKPKTNIQSLARENRYKLLIRQCKKDKINNLLLGHQIDDVYENFFIRLFRGSGLKGLSSFGKKTDYKKDNINLLRPLINVQKKDLIFLANKVFSFFIKDPSNLNEKFMRIRIRNLMNTFEREGFDKKKFRLTIKNLKDSNSTINFYVKKNIEENAVFFKNKNTYLLNNLFFNQPHEVIFRSFSFLLKSISGKYYAPRGKSIENLILKIKLNLLNKATLGSCYIEKVNKTILISRENSFKS